MGTQSERRFSERAGVACRGTSLALQRVLADFGADVPFGQVPDKLREHYGIAMPVSTAQRITEHHAQAIYEQETAREEVTGAKNSRTFIGEIDGSMVPVVEVSPDAQDKRQGKTLLWKEVRLCLVHPVGSATPSFGGHFAGGAEESGRQWARCAAKAGFGPGSHLHAVGDGAAWITSQLDLRFGTQGAFLVDFFHLCEYLGEASKVCAASDPKAWMEKQKSRLQANQVDAVLEALAPWVEADHDDHPVTACDRYIRNRLSQLDYPGAIQRGLPIGSGEIESAHRYVIQERLKLPGAWWAPRNVEACWPYGSTAPTGNGLIIGRVSKSKPHNQSISLAHHFESHPGLPEGLLFSLHSVLMGHLGLETDDHVPFRQSPSTGCASGCWFCRGPCFGSCTGGTRRA